MNKHYFLAKEIRGWFKRISPREIGQTKVRLEFFFPTLISRKVVGGPLPLLVVFLFAFACEPASDTSGTETGKHSPDGKALYRQHCVTCHGADGTLGLNGAGDLTQSALPLETRIVQITQGKNLMTAFGGVLTSEEIRAVAAYSETLKK